MNGESWGFVSIVGAGPGHPELISVLGARRLAAADVVLYDRLIDPEILSLARPSTQLVDVGKQTGCGSAQQQRISERLVELARQGKRVVRLKGGDPFVFGRGAEEAVALYEAGVPFEIVPGISSALAGPAYAGIPLTHRAMSRGFAVVTGRTLTGEAPGPEEIDWEALARFGGTLVFLMAAETLQDIVGSLISAGMGTSVPAAVVESASYPSQRCVQGSLGDIVEKAASFGIGPPAVLVVGEVVRLREKVMWYEKLPLFGKRVLVVRPRDRAGELAATLRDLGAEVIVAPVTEIRPIEPNHALEDAVERLRGGGFSWLVFASRSGVEVFFEVLRAKGGDSRSLAGVKLAAVGSTTAAALRARGIEADYVPPKATAEALSQGLPQGYRAEPVLVVQARGGRPELTGVLRERGFDVEVVEAYESVPPPRGAGDDKVLDLLGSGSIDAAVFAASSQVEGFVQTYGSESVPGVVICIGPTTADACRQHGIVPVFVAEEPTVDALARKVVSALGGCDPARDG